MFSWPIWIYVFQFAVFLAIGVWLFLRSYRTYRGRREPEYGVFLGIVRPGLLLLAVLLLDFRQNLLCGILFVMFALSLFDSRENDREAVEGGDAADGNPD